MNALIWCDIETTGLDLNKSHLLETALVVTDYYGEVIDSISRITSPMFPTQMKEYIDVMESAAPGSGDRFVWEMHNKSGLWNEVIKNGLHYDRADREIAHWISEKAEKYNLVPGKIPMCGNSVHFDKYFLEQKLRLTSQMFSHRIIDISSIKELSKVLAPEIAHKWDDYCDKHGAKPHRALDDILFSIREYQFYLEQEFIQI